MAVEDFNLTCLDPVIYRYSDIGFPSIMYPCGKCVICLERKRRQWASRMEMESVYHKSCYFVTLTYRDEDLPIVNDIPTLSKTHYKTFLKTLRKKFPIPLRFFGVGEYGSESSRPHYHFIFYFDEYMSKDKFRSYIDKSWKYGFNTVKLGKVQRFYYIAKYCCKLGCAPLGALPSFQSSSQNPPIGYLYFENNMERIDSDINNVNYMISPTFKKSSLPRSFQNKINDRLDSLLIKSVNMHPSLVRSRSLKWRASLRLREYVKRYNSCTPYEIEEMRETIKRRYLKKHKKSQI